MACQSKSSDGYERHWGAEMKRYLYSWFPKLVIAMAAIKRHNLEAPIRGMWLDLHPLGMKKRKHRLSLPFPVIVDNLESMGYIHPDDSDLIKEEYTRLSRILHGRGLEPVSLSSRISLDNLW